MAFFSSAAFCVPSNVPSGGFRARGNYGIFQQRRPRLFLQCLRVGLGQGGIMAFFSRSTGTSRRNFMKSMGRRMQARPRLEFQNSMVPMYKLEQMNLGEVMELTSEECMLFQCRNRSGELLTGIYAAPAFM